MPSTISLVIGKSGYPNRTLENEFTQILDLNQSLTGLIIEFCLAPHEDNKITKINKVINVFTFN